MKDRYPHKLCNGGHRRFIAPRTKIGGFQFPNEVREEQGHQTNKRQVTHNPNKFNLRLTSSLGHQLRGQRQTDDPNQNIQGPSDRPQQGIIPGVFGLRHPSHQHQHRSATGVTCEAPWPKQLPNTLATSGSLSQTLENAINSSKVFIRLPYLRLNLVLHPVISAPDFKRIG